MPFFWFYMTGDLWLTEENRRKNAGGNRIGSSREQRKEPHDRM
jgi:hypothetical protein